MNNFKESLKVYKRKNVDEVIYREMFSEMNKLSDKLLPRAVIKEQIQERMEYLTDVFINFERTTERLNQIDEKDYCESEMTSIDKYMQKIIDKVEIEICDDFEGDKEKEQVKERAKTLKKIFKNYNICSQQKHQIETLDVIQML